MSDIDLRCGDWREVLADVEQVDALITDPPYGAMTHSGHRTEAMDAAARRELKYSSLTPRDVDSFCRTWARKTRGWSAVMSCSRLMPEWRDSMDLLGRYSFAPIPCVIPGMTVRLAGDGPSSWAVYLNVSRPRSKEWAKWGTLPGAYRATRTGTQHIGGKPLALMLQIVRDYTRPGDLVCDPCAGWGTTAIACRQLGRRFVGAEIDPDTHAKAIERIEYGDSFRPEQPDLFGGTR